METVSDWEMAIFSSRQVALLFCIRMAMAGQPVCFLGYVFLLDVTDVFDERSPYV